ncbi:MAG: glycosyltransferase family 39 protein [Tannerella sp.]|jgi:hypothetical protein|nr:glycosyltransferase family 39 protein [Tannerella sp.]
MTLIEKTDNFFTKHEKLLSILSLILATITSILLFDVKVSLSGDDCDYIVAAGEFWKNFTYPGHHGPLYPIILSPFVGIFGIKLVLLKALSVIFIVASLWFFYKSFQHIVPAIIIIPTLLLVSINPYVLFFASYTYSEPLFMFMQALFFYLFSKYFWNKNSEYSLKKDWGKYLALALAIMGMGLTRTIGFCVIGVIILYFIIERRWKDLIYTVSIFTIIFGIFYFLKPIIWPDSSSVQSFETLLAKNPYNPEQGSEGFSGIIQRLIDNSNIYLSGFLYKYFGFRSSSDLPLKDLPALSILTYILFIICFVSVFKKNKSLVFTGLYAGILIFANFILLHKSWAQDRILMVYYPYVLLFLIGGFYYIFNKKAFRSISFIFPLILASLFIGTGIHAKNRIGKNLPALQQYLLGNDLYGLTPDWENFVKMSRWANENLDKDVVIASRKPTISYVYTGRYFYGMYNVPYVNIHEITKQSLVDKNDNIFLTIEVGENQAILNNLAPLLQYIFVTKQGASFSINGKGIKSAIVYKIEKSLFSEDLINSLNEYKLNYTLDYDSFLKQYVEDSNVGYQIIDPDVLLQNIKDNNIRYLILAKIRVYTPQNTGLFINTIHQYVTFIQLKYPNRFVLRHTIGKEETCELAEYIGE